MRPTLFAAGGAGLLPCVLVGAGHPNGKILGVKRISLHLQLCVTVAALVNSSASKKPAATFCLANFMARS
jgi:hypothetical protein